MQEGDYTFQLTVTDSAGQQDTAYVTVIVQPGKTPSSHIRQVHGWFECEVVRYDMRLASAFLFLFPFIAAENNKPPVADAGPEKELTLPVDRTMLDGSKSSDDQKIATYHWEQTK